MAMNDNNNKLKCTHSLRAASAPTSKRDSLHSIYAIGPVQTLLRQLRQLWQLCQLCQLQAARRSSCRPSGCRLSSACLWLSIGQPTDSMKTQLNHNGAALTSPCFGPAKSVAREHQNKPSDGSGGGVDGKGGANRNGGATRAISFDLRRRLKGQSGSALRVDEGNIVIAAGVRRPGRCAALTR